MSSNPWRAADVGFVLADGSSPTALMHHGGALLRDRRGGDVPTLTETAFQHPSVWTRVRTGRSDGNKPHPGAHQLGYSGVALTDTSRRLAVEAHDHPELS